MSKPTPIASNAWSAGQPLVVALRTPHVVRAPRSGMISATKFFFHPNQVYMLSIDEPERRETLARVR
ncbi:MAG: hypothetical protein ACK5MT_20225, partial [Actinomycetales bacterium]